MKRVVLVGGGVRSGKSDFALERAGSLGARRRFVATAQAFDDEMRARIAKHRRERDASFETVEVPIDLPRAIDETDTDVVLVDCLTLWLSNLLCQGLDDEAIEDRFAELVEAIGRTRASVVLVTNEVGLGIVPENQLARRFRDASGILHRRVASVADEVHFATLGIVLRIKPGPVVPSSAIGGDDAD